MLATIPGAEILEGELIHPRIFGENSGSEEEYTGHTLSD